MADVACSALNFFAKDCVGVSEKEGDAWQKVTLGALTKDAVPPGIVDLEDLAGDDVHGFAQMHEEACRQGQLKYEDPETGYSVFTELAHKQRGWCCGSGARLR